MIMIENRFTFFFLLLLTLTSSLGVYWIHRLSLQQEKNYGHYPISIGMQLIANRYDVTGALINILTATSAYQYRDTNTTEFNQLRLQAYGKSTEPPWNIQAPKGIAYGKGEKLTLVGEVTMFRAPFLSHVESHITTNNVTIFTDKKLLTTDDKIEAWQPGIHVTSIGAHYDYGQQILNLLNKVEVEYSPQAKK